MAHKFCSCFTVYFLLAPKTASNAWQSTSLLSDLVTKIQWVYFLLWKWKVFFFMRWFWDSTNESLTRGASETRSITVGLLRTQSERLPMRLFIWVGAYLSIKWFTVQFGRLNHHRKLEGSCTRITLPEALHLDEKARGKDFTSKLTKKTMHNVRLINIV